MDHLGAASLAAWFGEIPAAVLGGVVLSPWLSRMKLFLASRDGEWLEKSVRKLVTTLRAAPGVRPRKLPPFPPVIHTGMVSVSQEKRQLRGRGSTAFGAVTAGRQSWLRWRSPRQPWLFQTAQIREHFRRLPLIAAVDLAQLAVQADQARSPASAMIWPLSVESSLKPKNWAILRTCSGVPRRTPSAGKERDEVLSIYVRP